MGDAELAELEPNWSYVGIEADETEKLGQYLLAEARRLREDGHADPVEIAELEAEAARAFKLARRLRRAQIRLGWVDDRALRVVERRQAVCSWWTGLRARGLSFDASSSRRVRVATHGPPDRPRRSSGDDDPHDDDLDHFRAVAA